MTGTRRNTLAGTLALALVMLVASQAWAITVETISGTVSDPLSRPIAGVNVTDGHQTVVTNSSGAYTLEESSLGTYTVRTSGSNINGTSRTVTPTDALSPVNFTLTYVLTASISPNVFNVTPKTLAISATSFAPPSGSCVKYTDSSTGSVVNMTYSSTTSKWTGNFTVAAGRLDGTYSWSVQHTNCGLVQLTNQATGTYLLDTSKPTVVGTSPADGGNLALASSPLYAVLADNGSGVNPSSITLSLTPLGGTTSSVAVSSFVAASGLVTSVTKTFSTIGKRYTLSVSATDYAGNTSTATAQFLRISYTILDTPTVNIYHDTPQNLGLDTATGNNKWIFPNFTIKASPYHVKVSGTNHAGWGAIPALIDLHGEHLRYLVGGQYSPPSTPDLYSISASAVVGWNDGLLMAQQIALMAKAANFANTTLATSPGIVNLGTLTAELPVTADQPWFTLDTVGFRPYVPGEVRTDGSDSCPNPDYCPPDPLEQFRDFLHQVQYKADYLVTYLADDEADSLALQIKAGEDAVECSGFPSTTDPDYLACKATPKVGLALALVLGVLRDSGGTYRTVWSESAQYAFWFRGLGSRPTPQTTEQFATTTANELLTGDAGSNWLKAVCVYAYCGAPTAIDGWLLSQKDAGPEDDINSVEAMAQKCSNDSNLNSGSPDRKACKQAGWIEVKDWYKDKTAKTHHLYSGWYRTRGTADGNVEALGGTWSGPDTDSGFYWHLGNPSWVWVGGQAYHSQSGTCGDNAWDKSVTESTDKKVIISGQGNTLYDVTRTRSKFLNDYQQGQGQEFEYLTHWNQDETCKDASGNTNTYSLGQKWRSTSTAIETIGTENRIVNHEGRVWAKLGHVAGASAVDAIGCGLSIAAFTPEGAAARTAAAFVGGVISCRTLYNQTVIWNIDIDTKQDF